MFNVKNVCYLGIILIYSSVTCSSKETSSIPDASDKQLDKNCGLQHTDDRYVQENTTALDEFPWLAQLKYFITNDKSHVTITYACNGALISPKYVLTTAECLTKKSWELLGVRLGEYNPRSDKDCTTDGLLSECSNPVVDVEVKKVIPHPDFTGRSYENDIGLVELKEEVKYSDYIRPICLPVSGKDLTAGTKLVASGWGDFPGSYNDVYILRESKKKSSSEVIPNDQCEKIYHEQYNIREAIITQNQFCAKEISPAGERTCYGDAGGPMMRNSGSRWEAIGLVSFGIGRVQKLPCEEGVIQVHTNVAKYTDWIKNAIK